jgi:hypothetical protein
MGGVVGEKGGNGTLPKIDLFSQHTKEEELLQTWKCFLVEMEQGGGLRRQAVVQVDPVGVGEGVREGKKQKGKKGEESS